MVDIQSKEVIDKVSEDLKVQPAAEIPRALANDIQLTFDVGHFPEMKVRGVGGSDAVSTTILTTHPTKRTFLTNAHVTITKDVNATSIFTTLSIQPRTMGAQSLILLRYEPLTKESNLTATLNFNPAIELEKGTEINVVNSSGTASIDIAGNIGFYEKDPQ